MPWALPESRSSSHPPRPRGDRLRRAGHVLLPGLAAAAALAASWRCWINPFVDSGREMDVPWRLLAGERLYRDVTYYYGPLGPWVSSAALRLLGDRWLSLEILCAALSGAILWGTFQLARRAGGPLAATAATTLAAALCLGAPRGGAFIFPYSSSSLFALAGGLLALVAATGEAQDGHEVGRRVGQGAGSRGRPIGRKTSRGVGRRDWTRDPAWRLAAGSLGLAIAFAARLEIGLAAAIALALAALRSRSREDRWTDLATVAAGALLAAGLYAVAAAGIPWTRLVADGPFGPFLAMPPEWRFLYLQTAGLAKPATTAGRMALSLALDGLFVAAAARLALPRRVERLRDDGAAAPGSGRAEHLPKHPQEHPLKNAVRRHLFAAGGLLVVAAYLASPLCKTENDLPPLLLALPLLAAAAALAELRRPLDGAGRARFLLFAWSAAVALRVFFGLGVGPRMSPNAALPLPGLLATAAVLGFDRLARRLPEPRIFRRRLAALFALVGLLFLYRLARLDHRPERVEVETAAGSLRLPAPQAAAVKGALADLERSARYGDTLTAFPESGFFNFATGLRSPLRQDLVLPGVLWGAREADAARQIAEAGPRFVLLCNRPTAEYGPDAFGRDYDALLWRTVLDHYALAAAFGPARPDAPVGDGAFFIRLYERRRLAPAPVELAANGARPAPRPRLALLR